MNWKTIRHLIGVDRKSSRLLRGRNLRKYNVKINALYNNLYYVIVTSIICFLQMQRF
jgi:hypothetical protein